MTINWADIWKVFSPYYKDGKFIVQFDGRDDVELSAGPSFGDGSHPTTNFILKHLKSEVKDKIVVDVGAGSGILSLAAKSFGAKKVYSLEIDPPSIEHLQENIALNNSLNIFINETPKENIDVVLINMISSEQKKALKQYPFVLQKGVKYLISGILKEEVGSIAEKLYEAKVEFSEVEGDWGFILASTTG